MKSDEELVTLIVDQLQSATDFSNNELQQMRADAWDRYLVRPYGNERPGRSAVLDTSIRDTVNALMAVISPTYDVANLIDFPPMGEQDVEQSDAEAFALNAIFRKGGNITQITTAIKDALLFRNGVLKTTVETDEIVEHRRFTEPAALVEAGLAEYVIDAEFVDSV
jgi:hypothetical protein